MYKRHFGLNDKPFNLIPDPDYLYLSQKHKIGLSLLEYGLTETAAGLTVVTGDVGAGKTTLIRKLMRRIDYNELVVGLINNTGPFKEDLLSWVATAYNLEHEGKDKISIYKDLQKFLITQYAQGRRTVLIIDEAQNLAGNALEELRMLTNINADRDQLLQIILVGQPQLLEVFKDPDLAQIAQRVSVEYHLTPLDLEDTHHYIHHRTEVAGSQSKIFKDEAIDAMFYFSGGVPRLINTLADYSLVHGYALDAQEVDLDIVIEVAKGRKIGGVNRFVKADAIEGVRQKILSATGKDLAKLME